MAAVTIDCQYENMKNGVTLFCLSYLMYRHRWQKHHLVASKVRRLVSIFTFQHHLNGLDNDP